MWNIHSKPKCGKCVVEKMKRENALCCVLLNLYIFPLIVRKSDAQKKKEKEESDDATMRFYFNLYLERHGLERKLLQDGR